MARWLNALKTALRSLFTMEKIEEERPEQADPARHDDLQCKHCGHIHKEPDGSCDCGCSIAEV